MTKAHIQTLNHMRRVAELLGTAAQELIRRGAAHDLSKLEPVEMQPLEDLMEYQEQHGQAAFGTPGYEQQRARLEPMLRHHYRNNSHHPEHYPNGVDGMDLFDVVEMFYDWKAASERGGEDAMFLTAAAERYKLSAQLLSIFRNTAERLDFPHK